MLYARLHRLGPLTCISKAVVNVELNLRFGHFCFISFYLSVSWHMSNCLWLPKPLFIWMQNLSICTDMLPDLSKPSLTVVSVCLVQFLSLAAGSVLPNFTFGTSVGIRYSFPACISVFFCCFLSAFHLLCFVFGHNVASMALMKGSSWTIKNCLRCYKCQIIAWIWSVCSRLSNVLRQKKETEMTDLRRNHKDSLR